MGKIRTDRQLNRKPLKTCHTCYRPRLTIGWKKDKDLNWVCPDCQLICNLCEKIRADRSLTEECPECEKLTCRKCGAYTYNYGNYTCMQCIEYPNNYNT